MTGGTAGGAPAAAVFDLDGTLTKPLSIARFAVRLAGVGPATGAAVRGVGAMVRGPRRRRFKAAALGSVLRGRPLAEVRREGGSFAAELHRRRMRRGMGEQVARHRREGAYLLLVTCALDVYVEPFAAALGFDAVVAARVLADPAGRCTGALAHADLRGGRKARAAEEHLRAAGMDPAVTAVRAYGNSRDDGALLAWARRTPTRSPAGGTTAAP